ncbi:hypothetical protein HMPREF0043_00898 [Actinobaculum sp. oral taxon 183 str. F0552]|nr:hypothetical protein HMPREF0043_00898 [Actinobaculum sp. oral taxon 183 str. F0552]
MRTGPAHRTPRSSRRQARHDAARTRRAGPDRRRAQSRSRPLTTIIAAALSPNGRPGPDGPGLDRAAAADDRPLDTSPPDQPGKHPPQGKHSDEKRTRINRYDIP